MTIHRRVLVTATNYSTLCCESRVLFEKNGWQVIENIFGRPMTFDELKERVGDIDAVVAGVDTWNEAVFQLAPKLKIISRFGVGVDNIDVEAARRGIWDRFVGQELVGRTIGFLGFGAIAQKVARKLAGFEVGIIAYDKYPNLEAAKKLQVTMVSAEE